ncbi:MAG: dihydroorotate dehydrogenase (quinone) [Cellulomonas sp. 73-145]|uniref:quinone-dependent dihydroorotate dehydrogenase n=1 Tax=Cellulomonas sp. 73-145 TaxID=1895739 RepID=UPI000928E489|nr:quinone-dependent dihydroorotate dehydrogenase [Cellulomonas sp. 73-145]MBN9327255.1 quinone-dependent dihydroorotate dehydrogenase [Cellulomonas sp.]OJV58165.1 MAG: dihydroorotate dehydrogenase (quinone) [Cellulomonas sp. 73-145]
MYRLLFDLVLRRLDPEQAHAWSFALIRGVSDVPGLRWLVGRVLGGPPTGALTLWGRRWPSRLGLAAGFDKDGHGVLGMTMLGFGFVEVGTVTAQPQPGNEPPRLWRVLDQQALRNRMGFNNEGSAVVAERLRRLRATRRGRAAVIGVNIGKSRVTPVEHAATDYATSAGRLAPYADYLVVNVSSPNTPGLRDLQAVDALRPVLEATRVAADEATVRAGRGPCPLLVKIAPDLSDDDVDAVAELVAELGLDGVVAVNTTIAHDLGPGGLSGPPLLSRGLDVVARLRDRLGPEAVIIGVGGISTPADARGYLAVGATLVQAYTGLIYRGPFFAARISRALGVDASRSRTEV